MGLAIKRVTLGTKPPPYNHILPHQIPNVLGQEKLSSSLSPDFLGTL